MKRFRPITRFSTLLLLVLTLHTFAHSLVLPKLEISAFQDQNVCTETVMADDSKEQANEDDCKPPKHSFIDYSTFFYPRYLIPTHNPSISKLQLHEPLQAQPKVYLEIVVPPDSLA